MKGIYKNLISSIISCALVICVVVCAITVFKNDSTAWFARNKPNANGLSFKTEQDIVLKSAQLIKYDEEDSIFYLVNLANPYNPTSNNGIDTSNMPDCIKPENCLNLNKYDTVFVEEKSVYTPIIIKLTLGNVLGSQFEMNVNYSKILDNQEINDISLFETIIDENTLVKKHEIRSNISNVLEVRCIMNNASLQSLFNSVANTITEQAYNNAKAVFGVTTSIEEDANVNNPTSEIITSTNHVDRTFVLYDEDSSKQEGTRVTYTTDGNGDIITTTPKQDMNFKFNGNSPINSNGDVDVYIYLGYNVVLINEYIYHKTGSAEIKADSLKYGNKVDFDGDVIGFSFDILDN